MNRYQLVEGQDGIVWVSIQPLQQDILENLDKLRNTTSDDPEIQRGIDMKIYAMQSLYEFTGALLTEHFLAGKTNEIKQKH